MKKSIIVLLIVAFCLPLVAAARFAFDLLAIHPDTERDSFAGAWPF